MIAVECIFPTFREWTKLKHLTAKENVISYHRGHLSIHCRPQCSTDKSALYSTNRMAYGPTDNDVVVAIGMNIK